MKNQEIEKLIREDLHQSAPDDFSALRGRISSRAEETEVELAVQPAYAAHGARGGGNATGKGLWKRLLAVGLAFLLLISAIAILFSHLFGGKKIDAGYFVIDVNPSIRISYDEKGLVTEAEGLNLDGKTLLATTQLIGTDYNAAMDTVFARCVALGYFNSTRDNNAILISANKAEGGVDSALVDEVKQKFISLFSSSSMQGVVLTGAEETQFLQELAHGFGIDAQKYALIMTAQSMGVTIEEADYLSISVSEIYRKIQEKTWAQLLADIEEIGRSLQAELNALFTTLQTDLTAISAQLQSILEEVDILSAQRYQIYKELIDGHLQSIEAQLSTLEKQLTAEMIMYTLDEIRRAEDDIAIGQGELVNLLRQTHGKMQLALESIEKKAAKVNYIQGDPNTLGDAREDKFLDGNATVQSEFDFSEVWQQTQNAQASEDFFATWYAVKQKWKEYRVEDLR